MSKFETFARLHVPGDPLVLFNAWDPGSAAAVAESGAKAIATGSASVAMANGFGDGEEVPLDLALGNAARIVGAVELPVTVDFEGGYATDVGGPNFIPTIEWMSVDVREVYGRAAQPIPRYITVYIFLDLV